MSDKPTCPTCHRTMICPHCTGAAGGKLSKRKITPDQQAKMQAARQKKKVEISAQ